MDTAKQKISVTLDAELLAELRRHPGSVSGQLNDALRAEIKRRRGQQAWMRYLAELDEAEGPLDSPEDVAERERIEQVWRSLDELADGPAEHAS